MGRVNPSFQLLKGHGVQRGTPIPCALSAVSSLWSKAHRPVFLHKIYEGIKNDVPDFLQDNGEY